MNNLFRRVTATIIIGIAWLSMPHAEAAEHGASRTVGDLWAHDNFFASTALHSPEMKQSLEEKAEMLEKLGFKQCSCVWWDQDVSALDAGIESLKHHGIRMLAWTVLDADELDAKIDWNDVALSDPETMVGLKKPTGKEITVRQLLEAFRRHDVHPRLWLAEVKRIELSKPVQDLSEAELSELVEQRMREDFPRTAQEQRLRVEREADRIAALVRLTAPYGVKVDLYKHGNWFGVVDNELAVIERLKTLGVRDVGIVYPFIHARDKPHDDLTDFPALWRKIEPYVVAVNITGMHSNGTILNPQRESDKVIIYPGQGTRELEMMRTIEKSVWRGPIGLSDEKGGDSQANFADNLIGIDWLAAELKQAGSGGPRPFALMP